MRQYWPVEDRLRTHLAENMVSRGNVISEKHRSNEFVCVDQYELRYRGFKWNIVFVDRMASEIRKMEVS